MNPLSILRDAWYFVRRNCFSILGLCLPLLLLETLARQGWHAWHGEMPAPLHDLVLGLLFYPLYTVSLILFLDARSRGERPGNAQLWAAALQRWPVFALLAGISSLLIMLGASLLVLPGLWVMVKLVYAEYLLVLENEPPLSAIRRSMAMARGQFLPVLALLLCTLAPLWLADAWLADLGQRQGPSLLLMALDLALGALQLFPSIVMFRLYMLRREQA